MKAVRVLWFATLFGIAGSVMAQYASPEVMLVSDLGFGSSGPRIERYDPISGQYLGSIGTGYLHTPIGLCVKGSEVYVTDIYTVGSTYYSKINKFNWSTGTFDGSIFESSPYQFNSVQTYNNSLLVTDFGGPAGQGVGLYTYDLTSGARLGYTNFATGANPWRMTIHNGQAFVANRNGTLVRYNLNANGTVSGAGTTIATSGSFYGAASNTGTHMPGEWIYDEAYTGSSYQLERRNTAGGLVDVAASGPLYNALAFGHNSVLYGLDYSALKVDRFDADAGLYLGPMGSFALTQSGSVQDIAVFAAPEPFSMAALGIGLLTLLRRKRKA